MPEEYKSNSHKAREARTQSAKNNRVAVEKKEDKKLEKVVKGDVITKKKSVGDKFVDTFITEDVDNVKSYVFFDVVVPAIKDIIADALLTTVEMLLFSGESRRGYRRSGGRDRKSYDKYYDKRDSRSNERTTYGRTRERLSYDNVIIPDRGEAEDVKERLLDIIDEYGMVAVSDFYELVGLPSNYTDTQYGWYDLNSLRIERAGRDGYILRLPKTQLLD